MRPRSHGLIACAVLTLATAPIVVSARPTGNPSPRGAIAAERPEPRPERSAEREAKNKRYNGGRCDITTTENDNECLFDQYEPRGLPLVPTKPSTIIAVGKVVSVKSYLSADRTHIYTETAVNVEELLKHRGAFKLPSDQQLITDHIGGDMQLSSGRIVHDKTRSGFMGKLRVGDRYVLFAHHIHKGKDLAIIMAYELRNGKVYELAEDGSAEKVLLSKTPNDADTLSSEEGFLGAIRRSRKGRGIGTTRYSRYSSYSCRPTQSQFPEASPKPSPTTA